LWGHEPRVAYNGAQALELARVHRPDVALLDLSLPRLNGYDVAVQLRRQPESRDAVLIAITGHAELQARRRASACGFARFLVKPVEPDALETLLTELRDRLLGATSKRRKSKATGRMVLPRPSDPPRARG
jgi:two-component system CheB/CheR fusion protein